MSLLYHEVRQMHTLDELMIPEGYRHYARLEGLDPSSYFQIAREQSILPYNQAFISAGGAGPSWRILWRFFSMLRNPK